MKPPSATRASVGYVFMQSSAGTLNQRTPTWRLCHLPDSPEEFGASVKKVTLDATVAQS